MKKIIIYLIFISLSFNFYIIDLFLALQLLSIIASNIYLTKNKAYNLPEEEFLNYSFRTYEHFSFFHLCLIFFAYLSNNYLIIICYLSQFYIFKQWSIFKKYKPF